jgi:hypothetical protein
MFARDRLSSIPLGHLAGAGAVLSLISAALRFAGAGRPDAAPWAALIALGLVAVFGGVALKRARPALALVAVSLAAAAALGLAASGALSGGV